MARLLTNDFLGDRHDRWHTHSYQVGVLAEPSAGQSGPDLVELRFFTEALTPWSLSDPDPEDRPLAGIFSVGLHGYMLGDRASLHFGADLVGVGPKTHWDDFLDWFHPPGDEPGDALKEDQIGNGLHPTLLLAGTRSFPLGGRGEAMVFGELQAGAETLVRFGGDLLFGPASRGALPIRDMTTGLLIPATHLDAAGFGMTLGADAAYVDRSIYLPASRGYDLAEIRYRARAGGLWRWGTGKQVFYGLTWLSEEFEAQPEGQVVGSIHVNWRF